MLKHIAAPRNQLERNSSHPRYFLYPKERKEEKKINSIMVVKENWGLTDPSTAPIGKLEGSFN